MKIYEVDFEGIYPVGNCLIIAAKNIEEATEIAKNTITHTNNIKVIEVNIKKSGVIVYLDGDY